MANLYRLIFAVCLLALSAVSHAVITPSYTYKYNTGFIGTPSEIVAHQQALESQTTCNYGAHTITRVISFNNATASSVDIRYSFVCPTGNSVSNVLIYTAPRQSSVCPAGSALSGDSCQCVPPLVDIGGECKPPACPVGQHEEGGACVPDSCQPNETRVNGVCVPEPPCPAGQSRVNGQCKPFKCPTNGTASDQWYELESAGVSSTCLYNSVDKTYCVLRVTPLMAGYKDGKRTYMGGYGIYTGGTCGPSEPGKPRPVDPKNPDGDPDKGTKPAGPNDPKPSDKPTGSGGGGGPGNTPSPPNPDGTCPAGTYKSGGKCYQKDPPPKPPDTDGKCPSGYVKVGDSCIALMPLEDKDDGEEKSSFGGQCDAVACEGDAIQCAIVRDQYKRSCELMEKESTESQLYTTNKGKQGNQTGDLPGNQTINMAGRIDTSDALGAGSAGVSDLNVTVWGQSVTLPFSQVNPYLAHLGNILVAVSFLLAVRIVARG